MTIATTILEQMGGTSRLNAMIGANTFVDFSTNPESKYYEPSVGFRFKARAKNKANYIKVVLDPSDTYTVTFCRLHGYNTKEISSVSGIYAEQLIPLFEGETGLYLTL